MSLRSILLASIFVGLVAALAGTIIASRSLVESERTRNMLTALDDVERAVSELAIVAHEAAVLPGRRVEEQWSTRIASALARIDEVRQIEGLPDTQGLVARFERMDKLFLALGQVGRRFITDDAARRRRELLDRALLVESQQTLTDLDRIERVANASMEASSDRIALAFLSVTIVLGGFALCVPAFLFFRLTKPLSSLVAASRRIARGDYSARSRVTGSDEFGEFGSAFDVMAERVESTVGALAQAEDETRNILESAGDGILELDSNNRVAYVNSAGCRVLGRDREECVGRSLTEIWPGLVTLIDECRAAMGLADPELAGGSADNRVIMLRRPDGSLSEIECTVTETTLNAGAATVVTFHDVGPLLQRERLLDALVTHVHHGIAIWGADDRLARWNPAYEQMLPELVPMLRVGLPFAEIVRAAAPHRVQVDGSVDPQKHARTRLARHRTGDYGMEVRRTNGRVHIIDEVALPDGRLVEMFTDVSELSRREDELRRGNEELRRFAHLASHDLQEPLRSVVGFCELLQRRYSDRLDDDGREFIGFIVDASLRMQSLVRDLLTYARTGQDKADEAWFALIDVVKECVSDSTMTIEESGAQIEIVEPMPDLYGSRREIASVLQNLIGNALKFRSEAAPRIRIEARTNGGIWEIDVEDNGIGIAPEHMDRIFEPFSRLHAFEAYEGTGIGLAICNKAVERLGGRIEVESRVGVGTRFRLVLPRDSTREPAAPQAQAPGSKRWLRQTA